MGDPAWEPGRAGSAPQLSHLCDGNEVPLTGGRGVCGKVSSWWPSTAVSGVQWWVPRRCAHPSCPQSQQLPMIYSFT